MADGGGYETAAEGEDPFKLLPVQVKETIDAVVKPLGDRGPEAQQRLRFALLALSQDTADPKLPASFPSPSFRKRFADILHSAFTKRGLFHSTVAPTRRALFWLHTRQLESLATQALRTEEELDRLHSNPVSKATQDYEPSGFSEEGDWAALGHITGESKQARGGKTSPTSSQSDSDPSPGPSPSASLGNKPSMEDVGMVLERDRALVSHKNLHKIKKKDPKLRTQRKAKKKKKKGLKKHAELVALAKTGSEGKWTLVVAAVGLLLVCGAPGLGPVVCAAAAVAYPGYKSVEAWRGGVWAEAPQWAGCWLGMLVLRLVWAAGAAGDWAGKTPPLHILLAFYTLIQALQLPYVRGGEFLYLSFFPDPRY